MDGILTQKILSFLPRDISGRAGLCALQFQSGRRLYHCRAFVVNDHWSGAHPAARIALIMERGLPGYSSNTANKKLLAGMHEDAFSFTPDPKYYHRSRGHNEVYVSLRNLVAARRGIGVVLGQAGMGKTALMRYLKENLQNISEVVSFPGSFENHAEMVRSIMAIVGVQGISRNLKENLRNFEQWLISRREAGRTIVLVCDDAQDLDLETLQNLSLLSEYKYGQEKLLQIVMAGRHELLAKIGESCADAIGNSINMVCRLMPLDQAEVHSYVLHRLRIAGCDRQLFSSAALSSIALYSRGVPLNINMLCRHCMSLAAGISLPVVDDKLVADAAYDLVLRSQPANVWNGGEGIPGMNPPPKPGRLRDRRGLKLVDKL